MQVGQTNVNMNYSADVKEQAGGKTGGEVRTGKAGWDGLEEGPVGGRPERNEGGGGEARCACGGWGPTSSCSISSNAHP